MRIAYLVKRYPKFSETFIVNEILAHEAAGLPVEILALRNVAETHFQDGLARVRAPVTYVPESTRRVRCFWELLDSLRQRLPALWPTLANARINEVDDLFQALYVADLIERRGITHLHAHFGTVATTVARLAAAFAGITYGFTAHAKDIFHNSVQEVELRAKLRDASYVVTVSDFNLAYLRRLYGRDAAGVVRIYNGLDLTDLDFASPFERGPRIVAVGRLVEKKGFHVLIDALARLRARGRPVDCRIIGDGEERDRLARQIAGLDLQDRVQLAGPRPRADVLDEMRRSAAIVAPCIVGRDGNRDGLPTVLLEAMAVGTPTISTDVTGIPEVVRNGETGLLVSQNDAEALATAIAELTADGAQRARLAATARRRIEAEFDIARNTAELRRLFARAHLPRLDSVRQAS